MLGNDADNRRAKQKAAVPRGRYGSDREFGQHAGILPAVLNRIGTAFASPRPTAAKPISAVIGLPNQSPAANARAATPDPAARAVGPPQRRTTRSPRKRPSGHGKRECRETERRKPRAGCQIVAQIHRRPIADCTFGHQAAQHEHPEGNERTSW